MTIEEAVAKALEAGFTLLAIRWLLGAGAIIALSAAVTWVVKKVWNSGSGKQPRQKQRSYSDDWLTDTQERQQRRWDYSDPVPLGRKADKPKRSGEPKWYPSGWTFNEDTQLWEPPDYLQKEAHEKWKWDPDKGIWIDLEKQRRLERYNQFRAGKAPTYEEWKKAKLKEQAAEEDKTES